MPESALLHAEHVLTPLTWGAQGYQIGWTFGCPNCRYAFALPVRERLAKAPAFEYPPMYPADQQWTEGGDGRASITLGPSVGCPHCGGHYIVQGGRITASAPLFERECFAMSLDQVREQLERHPSRPAEDV